MLPGWLTAPLVVCVHHEVAGQVVAALLTCPVVAAKIYFILLWFLGVVLNCIQYISPTEPVISPHQKVKSYGNTYHLCETIKVMEV